MKTKRVGMYRPKHTKKNTNNKSKMLTKKTVKHKTLKRRPHNENKLKTLPRTWVEDFVYDEETVIGGGKKNKRTDGAGKQNYPTFNTSLKSNVKKSTVKKSSGKKSAAKVTTPASNVPIAKVAPAEVTNPVVQVTTPVETAPTAEVTPVETAPISKVSTDEVTNPVVQVTTPIETAPTAEVTTTEVANPKQNEVAIDKKIEEETDKNKDDSSCPSRDKIPHTPLNKSDYRSESLIFHPDKNTGCSDSATEKFFKLNEMEKLRTNPKTSNNITQPNSNFSIDNAEETVKDKSGTIPITNTPNPKLSTDIETSSSIKKKISSNDTTLNPTESSTAKSKETDYNKSNIGKFDVSISYPNGLSGSPMVNLVGTQGGDTDAVFGAISQESETPHLSKVSGGKSRGHKKNNQSKKPKKPKKHKNKTMKHRK